MRDVGLNCVHLVYLMRSCLEKILYILPGKIHPQATQLFRFVKHHGHDEEA